MLEQVSTVIERLDYIATILLYSIFVLSPIIFTMLFFITAPYGRYAFKAKTNECSSVLFSKRTGWLIMEVPAICTMFIVWVFSDVGLLGLIHGRSNMQEFLVFALFLCMWQFHYIYRSFIVPYLLPNEKYKFSFYISFMGLSFNIINGYINAWFLFFRKPKVLAHIDTAMSHLISFPMILGLILFFVGFYIHMCSDAVLRKMRQKNANNYDIPHTFLHVYVAAPNYFGEMLQWWGWALLTQSIAGLAFALFTMANLVPRAFSHLRWYRNTFEHYPKKRKAFIPYIV